MAGGSPFLSGRQAFNGFVAIAPADVDLAVPIVAIIATVGGTVVLTDAANGTTVTITLVAGVLYPIPPTKRVAAASTATGITGFA